LMRRRYGYLLMIDLRKDHIPWPSAPFLALYRSHARPSALSPPPAQLPSHLLAHRHQRHHPVNHLSQKPGLPHHPHSLKRRLLDSHQPVEDRPVPPVQSVSEPLNERKILPNGAKYSNRRIRMFLRFPTPLIVIWVRGNLSSPVVDRPNRPGWF